MITKLIEELLRKDERALAAAKKRLTRCEEGMIHIKRRNGSAAFYRELPKDEVGKRNEKHISKQDKRLITSLCSKRYCQRLIPVLEKETHLLKTFLNNYDPQLKFQVLTDLPNEIANYVVPLVKTNEQLLQEWENEPFASNPYPLDHDSYLSKKGEKVRSRLELISANMLYDLHIPYRYECELYLDDGSVSYPDFTLKHPQTFETYWLELFGMMDDPDYAAAAFQKIARYARSHVFPHMILVFDHHAAPFRTETLEELLRNLFLQ